jgi:hypothetical protein
MLHKLFLFALAVGFVVLITFRVRRASVLAPGMPAPLADAVQQALYRSPGGAYNLADIDANGGLLPAEKYRAFQARHDPRPQPGDLLCPVTRTKANPACTWIVGGREYQFCCPPCIDEFVRLAKERPQEIEPPGAYRQR